MALSNRSQTPDTAGHGSPVELGSPECSGGMFEFRAGGTVYFRCHTGHAWSPETLLDAERDSAESGLFAAAAKLREEAVVLRRLAAMDAAAGDEAMGRIRLRQAQEADARAVAVQQLLADVRRDAEEA